MIVTTTPEISGRPIGAYLGIVMGADAVVGVDLDYEVLGEANGMLMVSVSGTAVRLG